MRSELWWLRVDVAPGQASPLLGLFKTHWCLWGRSQYLPSADDREACAGSWHRCRVQVVFLRAMEPNIRISTSSTRPGGAEPSGPRCLLSVSNEGYLDGLKQNTNYRPRLITAREMANFSGQPTFYHASFCESFGMMAVAAMAWGCRPLSPWGPPWRRWPRPRASCHTQSDVAALVAASKTCSKRQLEKAARRRGQEWRISL